MNSKHQLVHLTPIIFADLGLHKLLSPINYYLVQIIIVFNMQRVTALHTLTLKVPENLQIYGLYVYYVVHICDFGMLRVNIDGCDMQLSSRKGVMAVTTSIVNMQTFYTHYVGNI